MKAITSIVVVVLGFASVSLADTPAIVQASLRLNNGGCSSTAIHKHTDRAFILTCDHCTGGAGSTFVVQSPHTGSSYTARVLATNRDHDLTLAVVQPDAARAVCEPAEYVPDDAEWIAAGYPCTSEGCTGPKFKRLSLRGTDTAAGRARNVYTLHSGPFAGGDSGGGVAIRYAGKERFVGTLSHSGPRGSTYRQTRAFLIRNAGKFRCRERGCDAWWCKPNVEIEPPEDVLPADAASQINARLDRLEEMVKQAVEQPREPAVDREEILKSVTETVQTVLDRREAEREQQQLRQELQQLRQEKQRLQQQGTGAAGTRQVRSIGQAFSGEPQSESRAGPAADGPNTPKAGRARLPAVGPDPGDQLLRAQQTVDAYLERRKRHDEILQSLKESLDQPSESKR